LYGSLSSSLFQKNTLFAVLFHSLNGNHLITIVDSKQIAAGFILSVVWICCLIVDCDIESKNYSVAPILSLIIVVDSLFLPPQIAEYNYKTVET